MWKLWQKIVRAFLINFDVINENDLNNILNMPDPKEKPIVLSSKDRNFWNGFVDYVEKKGLKGSADLDKRDLGLSKKLFDEYAKGAYTYEEFIPTVQQSIADYRNTAIQKARRGEIQIPGVDYTNKAQPVDVGDEALKNMFMSGLSDVDGWAGSRTTAWRFPREQVLDAKTQAVLPQANLVYEELAPSKYKAVAKTP